MFWLLEEKLTARFGPVRQFNRVKMPDANPNDLNSIPKIYMVEKMKSCNLFYNFHPCMHPHVHTHTHTWGGGQERRREKASMREAETEKDTEREIVRDRETEKILILKA